MNDTMHFRLIAAHNSLQRLASVNAPFGRKVTAEQEYGAAYQELVRQGLKPQIRGKYRGLR